MRTKTHAIGVFDSGVGGLTVLRKLAELLPNEDLLYLGDTARVPYGTKSASTIQLYSQQCTRFLLQHSVKLIVVACNTASATALQVVQTMSPVPVIGVIEPAAQAAVQASSNGHIGVIGTYATVSSRAYDTAIAAYSSQPLPFVHSQPCPLFVPLAEEGWNNHKATHLIAEEYLAPLREENIDTLIMGCTHYPLLADVIRDTLPGVQLIDSGEESAVEARAILAEMGNNQNNRVTPRTIDCFVTDMPRTFTSVAERFLGFSLTSVHQISLEDIAPLHNGRETAHNKEFC